MLKMDDEAGGDAKLLAVPIDKVLPIYTHWQKPEDINQMRLKAIQHFFEHYKDLEAGKWVKVKGWEGPDAAKAEIVQRHGGLPEPEDQGADSRAAGTAADPSGAAGSYTAVSSKSPCRPCSACLRAFVLLCCRPAGSAQPRRSVCRPASRRARRSRASTNTGCANGLQVLLVPDDSKPTTTVNLTYRVGSRHENYGETGMAHLLEHLMFKGSPKHPKVWAEFEKRGLAANGSTCFDRTNYTASFSANDGNLNWYLGWLADAMVNSFIARKDLDTEMTVVRNEMEMGENSPDAHPAAAHAGR